MGMVKNGDTRGEHSRVMSFRAADVADGDGLTLEGYGSTFDDPYEVQDWLGAYRERFARGSFAKTIKERRGKILVQYDHGSHPVLGSIPIGSLDDIREDDHGLFVRVRLHDNWMTEPLRDAIASGSVSGMSIRFRVIKDEWDYDADPEERTIREVALFEVGPVAMPANEATSVALRSLVARMGGVEAVGGLLVPERAVPDVSRGIVGGDSTSTPAGDATGSEAADMTEPASLVTRQDKRRMALLLHGVIPNGSDGTAADAAGRTALAA